MPSGRSCRGEGGDTDSLADGEVALVPDASGEGYTAVEPRPGWVREWQFLIWGLAIDTRNEEFFVELAQHRFLGTSESRWYNKFVWMLIMVVDVGVALVFTWLLAFIMLHPVGDLDMDTAISMTWFGLAVAAFDLLTVGLVYFTFVPPREYRIARDAHGAEK